MFLEPARYSCVAPLNTAHASVAVLSRTSAEILHLVGHSCIELAVALFSLKICPIVTSCTINIKRTALGSNTGFDVEMPATNHLSHGTALKYCSLYSNRVFVVVSCRIIVLQDWCTAGLICCRIRVLQDYCGAELVCCRITVVQN